MPQPSEERVICQAYCPACWTFAKMKFDKKGRPYLHCGTGCRFFTTSVDSLGALQLVSEFIEASLALMQSDPAHRARIENVIVRRRASLRSILSGGTPASSSTSSTDLQETGT